MQAGSSLDEQMQMLSMIILPTDTFHYALPTDLQRLEARVNISSEKNDTHAVMSLLRPLHTPASDLAWVSTAAQQLAHQMAAKWPELSSFGMGCVGSKSVGTTIIAHLTKGKWPSLRYVSFSRCQLKVLKVCCP